MNKRQRKKHTCKWCGKFLWHPRTGEEFHCHWANYAGPIMISPEDFDILNSSAFAENLEYLLSQDRITL